MPEIFPSLRADNCAVEFCLRIKLFCTHNLEEMEEQKSGKLPYGEQCILLSEKKNRKVQHGV
jgi:hypothetical protein